MQGHIFTNLGCDALNRKCLIAQRIPHMLDDILGGRISESATCRRDCFAEGLNGVKAEEDGLDT
jgi:hypothetical protein